MPEPRSTEQQCRTCGEPAEIVIADEPFCSPDCFSERLGELKS